jgi:Raf kinase inhibitor-like YbhB/YbcL family protein
VSAGLLWSGLAWRELVMSLALTSTAFAPGGAIPKNHTCDGKDLAPPLDWSGVPSGTKSLALIVDDPDAPSGMWVHWVLYDLPPDSRGLALGTTSKTLPAGTREGLNDWKQTGYRGPCPPSGRHRYFHKLYALDVVLPDLKRPTKVALEAAMEGHVLAEVELIGTYQRQR